MNPRKSRTISTSIPESTFLTLQKLAEESSRTASGYIRWLINRHLWELEGAKKAEDPPPDQQGPGGGSVYQKRRLISSRR